MTKKEFFDKIRSVVSSWQEFWDVNFIDWRYHKVGKGVYMRASMHGTDNETNTRVDLFFSSSGNDFEGHRLRFTFNLEDFPDPEKETYCRLLCQIFKKTICKETVYDGMV